MITCHNLNIHNNIYCMCVCVDCVSHLVCVLYHISQMYFVNLLDTSDADTSKKSPPQINTPPHSALTSPSSTKSLKSTNNSNFKNSQSPAKTTNKNTNNIKITPPPPFFVRIKSPINLTNNPYKIY